MDGLRPDIPAHLPRTAEVVQYGGRGQEGGPVWFKHRAWIPVAWLLSLANLGAAWFAARTAEPTHATVHALLAVLFGLGAQYLGRRKRSTVDPDIEERLRELEARLADLAQLSDPENRLAELEERLDFTERALVDVRRRAPLPPKE
jgi:hypothetical protein